MKLIPGCVAGGIAPNPVNRLIVAGAGAGALVVVLALSVAFSGGVGGAFAALAGAGMDFGVGMGAGVGISAAIGAGSVIIIGKLYMSSLGLKGLFYLIFLPAMLGLLAAGSSNPGWLYLENEIAQSAAILAWLLLWLMPHEGRGLLWLCERVAEWLGAPIQPPKGSTTCYHRPWRGAPWQKSIAP